MRRQLRVNDFAEVQNLGAIFRWCSYLSNKISFKPDQLQTSRVQKGVDIFPGPILSPVRLFTRKAQPGQTDQPSFHAGHIIWLIARGKDPLAKLS